MLDIRIPSFPITNASLSSMRARGYAATHPAGTSGITCITITQDLVLLDDATLYTSLGVFIVEPSNFREGFCNERVAAQ